MNYDKVHLLRMRFVTNEVCKAAADELEQLRTTVAEQQKRIAELEEALKNHQEQTRPIEHTINVLKQIRQPGKSVAPFLVAYKEQLTTAQAQIKVLREALEHTHNALKHFWPDGHLSAIEALAAAKQWKEQ